MRTWKYAFALYCVPPCNKLSVLSSWRIRPSRQKVFAIHPSKSIFNCHPRSFASLHRASSVSSFIHPVHLPPSSIHVVFPRRSPTIHLHFYLSFRASCHPSIQLIFFLNVHQTTWPTALRVLHVAVLSSVHPSASHPSFIHYTSRLRIHRLCRHVCFSGALTKHRFPRRVTYHNRRFVPTWWLLSRNTPRPLHLPLWRA